jgi:hypothetical protein
MAGLCLTVNVLKRAGLIVAPFILVYLYAKV